MKEDLIRIGGVPEHFNFPWKLRLNQAQPGFNWKDFPGGSGAMIQALTSGELDAALVLTESVAHALNQNLPVEPLAVFVESPLIWGIFSGANNPIHSADPHSSLKYAISRFGSGSHLMAKVDAYIRGGRVEEGQFELIGNLDGAVSSLSVLKTDLFFWEKWMTKPLVDKGILKMIGERPTPWSCFQLVVNEHFTHDGKRMEILRSIYQQVLKIAGEFSEDETAARQLSNQYGLDIQDATDWLKQVKWAKEWKSSADQLQLAKDWLQKTEG